MSAGLIQPDLLQDGQVCVDMGEPILDAEQIPTTLPSTQVLPQPGSLMRILSALIKFCL